mgnify:CR=1 FL=1
MADKPRAPAPPVPERAARSGPFPTDPALEPADVDQLVRALFPAMVLLAKIELAGAVSISTPPNEVPSPFSSRMLLRTM